MLTLERASEIVQKINDFYAAADLFTYFEEILNPHSPELEEGRQWQAMFAGLCGFGVVSFVES